MYGRGLPRGPPPNATQGNPGRPMPTMPYPVFPHMPPMYPAQGFAPWAHMPGVPGLNFTDVEAFGDHMMDPASLEMQRRAFNEYAQSRGHFTPVETAAAAASGRASSSSGRSSEGPATVRCMFPKSGSDLYMEIGIDIASIAQEIDYFANKSGNGKTISARIKAKFHQAFPKAPSHQTIDSVITAMMAPYKGVDKYEHIAQGDTGNMPTGPFASDYQRACIELGQEANK